MTATPDPGQDAPEGPAPAAETRQPLPREGRVDALAGPQPDGIPMTGEEDPLVEVEQFSEAVRRFSESERDRKA
ncbi:hypothetical protein [Sphingomonas pokkalii]|uniref:Uncharacterized protein n=1 Tax=Sphingomonas pokkalii TaxID=2175090 RepID=A0A2U0S9D0_9SPHN|nr:hypothetical protein [Sphingomonas pokkalii]PVX27944.1 hypothetical protein DD559_00090 [Sphingomonas pokkalii]